MQSEIKKVNTDFEVESLDDGFINEPSVKRPWWYNLEYLFAGIFFGIVLVKGEVISWFRIQEMFHLQSFHMYGVIGSAIVVGTISILIIKKFNIKTFNGEKIELHPKPFSKGQIYGGLLFGFGWAMTGACPGPLFALVGSGALVISVTLFSAIAGTWLYGYLRDKLPH
ncbi:MAG: YeeE/YedE family protein [Bacteroidia bacterium]|nr:YeeE/YedE family protein [Bacteroidia bacterium]